MVPDLFGIGPLPTEELLLLTLVAGRRGLETPILSAGGLIWPRPLPTEELLLLTLVAGRGGFTTPISSVGDLQEWDGATALSASLNLRAWMGELLFIPWSAVEGFLLRST